VVIISGVCARDDKAPTQRRWASFTREMPNTPRQTTPSPLVGEGWGEGAVAAPGRCGTPAPLGRFLPPYIRPMPRSHRRCLMPAAVSVGRLHPRYGEALKSFPTLRNTPSDRSRRRCGRPVPARSVAREFRSAAVALHRPVHRSTTGLPADGAAADDWKLPVYLRVVPRPVQPVASHAVPALRPPRFPPGLRPVGSTGGNRVRRGGGWSRGWHRPRGLARRPGAR